MQSHSQVLGKTTRGGMPRIGETDGEIILRTRPAIVILSEAKNLVWG